MAGAMTLDPELALWVPGRKTFFLPTTVVLGPGNTFLTIEQITREALRMLESNVSFARRINRRYDEPFTAGAGTIVSIPAPPRYVYALT